MENLKETVDIVVNSRYPEMNREGRELLAQVLIRKELEKGEMLLNEGQISRHMVFVGKGMLRQFYYKNGKDVTEHFSYEGCILMCIESLLKQEPTHLMAEALEPAVVYMLPYDVLQKLLEQSKEINAFYRKVLEYSLIVSANKGRSWRFETATRTLQPTLAPSSGDHQTSSIITHCLLPADDPETLSRVRSGVLLKTFFDLYQKRNSTTCCIFAAVNK